MGSSCPKDVQGRVPVGVVDMTTRDAPELGLGDAVLRCRVPALGTSAGGVAGVDEHHLSPSLFRFGKDAVHQHPPTRVVDGLVETRLGGGTVGGVGAVAVR